MKMRERNYSASNVKTQTTHKLISQYRQYLRHHDPLLSKNDSELDDFITSWKADRTLPVFDIDSFEGSQGKITPVLSRRSSFSLSRMRNSIRSSHETADQINNMLKSISENEVRSCYCQNEDYGLIDGFAIYGVGRKKLAETIESAQKMPNSQEIMKKFCKNNVQSKVELLECWHHDMNNEGMRRSLEDYRDIIFQNDISLKPMITEDQCYE